MTHDELAHYVNTFVDKYLSVNPDKQVYVAIATIDGSEKEAELTRVTSPNCTKKFEGQVMISLVEGWIEDENNEPPSDCNA